MLKEENMTRAPTLKCIMNWRWGEKEKPEKSHAEQYGRQKELQMCTTTQKSGELRGLGRREIVTVTKNTSLSQGLGLRKAIECDTGDLYQKVYK